MGSENKRNNSVDKAVTTTIKADRCSKTTKSTNENDKHSTSENSRAFCEVSPLVLLTGGGTGGHVYPNLALVPELKKRGYVCAYVGGSGDTLERRAAEKCGLNYYELPTIKLVRGMSMSAIKNNLLIPFELNKCVKKGRELLRQLRPSLVFSKGGYAALPLSLASPKECVPIICHESDLTVGLANKLSTWCGARLLTAHPYSANGDFVGMPLRDELFSATKKEGREKLGITGKKRVLLIVGGSGGAKTLNDLVEQHFDELTKKYNVIHIFGKNGDFHPREKSRDYFPFNYADDISYFYAVAEVILARAGATAVAEISALKKRAVFVPLPKGVSRGDQLDNAVLAHDYGATILYQTDSIGDQFLNAIDKAFEKPPMRSYAGDTNRKIADIIDASIGRGDLCINKKP